ncbi:MAG TPA: DUF3795 domain-containing protein [Planctomycetota bacterium]|nr:DUF3795 domain-containing protein [Planctomycetota bacterium]
MTQLAYCGIDCSKCSYRAKTNCPGCQACAGKMFWGECDLAKCCIGKGLENCGKCSDCPCEQRSNMSWRHACRERA